MGDVVWDNARGCFRVIVAKQSAAVGVHLGRDRLARHHSAVESTPIRSTGSPDWANSSAVRSGEWQ